MSFKKRVKELFCPLYLRLSDFTIITRRTSTCVFVQLHCKCTCIHVACCLSLLSTQVSIAAMKSFNTIIDPQTPSPSPRSSLIHVGGHSRSPSRELTPPPAITDKASDNHGAGTVYVHTCTCIFVRCSDQTVQHNCIHVCACRYGTVSAVHVQETPGSFGCVVTC